MRDSKEINMTNRVVIIGSGSHGLWLLSSVKRDELGRILSAWVENGAWAITFNWGSRVGCSLYSDGSVANYWLLNDDLKEVPVPDDMLGDYREILCWAERGGKS